MEIELTGSEIMLAGYVGLRRQVDSIVNNRRPHYPERYPGEMMGYGIYAAMAEMAFCKMFGRFWDGSCNTFHVPDVPGSDIEIRWSMSRTIKVRPDDNNVRVAKMTGLPPRFVFEGWVWSEDAKKDKWKRDPGGVSVPAYFVPINEANTPESLEI